MASPRRALLRGSRGLAEVHGASPVSGLDPVPWTPRKRGCSSWDAHVGGSLRSTKDEAVKLVINTGRTAATVARELGLKEQTLGRWVHDFKARAAAGEAGQGGLSETERAELLRLRRENSDLKLDRAFLKKASLFFAQEASATNTKRSS